MTEKNRIAYLDVARGIGMILVVMGHVEYVDVTVRQWISAFHMPLFFLISGILIWEKQEEKHNYTALVKRKVRGFLLPYAIFSVLSFCIEGGRLAVKGLDEWDVVFRQLFQSLCLQGVSTLWFLPALLMSELLFIEIRKKTKNSWTFVIISVIVVLADFLNTIEKGVYQKHMGLLGWELAHDILSMILRNLFCVGFVGAGYYIGKYLLPRISALWVTFIGMLMTVAVAAIVIPMNWGVDLRYMNIGSLPLFLVGAISGTMSVLLFSKILEAAPLSVVKESLAYYGRNSLIIMVTHMDFRVLYCSIKIASIIQFGWKNQAVLCLCIIAFVFLIEIPIIWFVNRYIPFILGKKHKIS